MDAPQEAVATPKPLDINTPQEELAAVFRGSDSQKAIEAAGIITQLFRNGVSVEVAKKGLTYGRRGDNALDEEARKAAQEGINVIFNLKPDIPHRGSAAIIPLTPAP